MNLNEFIPRMDREISDLGIRLNQGNVALLTWFLMNYFRLDEETAQEAICDSPGDKGIDGIYIDHYSEEIVVFQSKYSPHPMSNQGDNDLRNFVGASQWLRDQATLTNLLQDKTASPELVGLINRTKLLNYVDTYTKTRIFVTNRRFDHMAIPYITGNVGLIVGYDIDRLFSEYTYEGRGDGVKGVHSFPVDFSNLIRYQTGNNLKAVIFPIGVLDLANLNGIQDRKIFERNVRHSLGKTRVNRDITKTLEQAAENENFFLYHNGITMICRQMSLDPNNSIITVEDYSIVNGCQSTVTFYENRKILNANIKVLIRVVEVGEDNIISDRITNRTNNQNSISLKDLKANDPLQISLQQGILEITNGDIFYKIKPGETGNDQQRTIENDFVAQMITAFDLEDPSIVHQKTKVFSDDYNKVFHRHITAEYIIFMLAIFDVVNQNKDIIEDDGIRSYKVSLFFFMYVLRLFLEDDEKGRDLLSNPATYDPKYSSAIVTTFRLMARDFNAYIRKRRAEDKNFDYKNMLRNGQSVEDLGEELLVLQQKYIERSPESSISELINKIP